MVKRVNRKLDSTVYGFGRPKYTAESEDEEMVRWKTIEDVPEGFYRDTVRLLLHDGINQGLLHLETAGELGNQIFVECRILREFIGNHRQLHRHHLTRLAIITLHLAHRLLRILRNHLGRSFCQLLSFGQSLLNHPFRSGRISLDISFLLSLFTPFLFLLFTFSLKACRLFTGPLLGSRTLIDFPHPAHPVGRILPGYPFSVDLNTLSIIKKCR